MTVKELFKHFNANEYVIDIYHNIDGSAYVPYRFLWANKAIAEYGSATISEWSISPQGEIAIIEIWIK